MIWGKSLSHSNSQTGRPAYSRQIWSPSRSPPLSGSVAQWRCRSLFQRVGGTTALKRGALLITGVTVFLRSACRRVSHWIGRKELRTADCDTLAQVPGAGRGVAPVLEPVRRSRRTRLSSCQLRRCRKHFVYDDV